MPQRSVSGLFILISGSLSAATCTQEREEEAQGGEGAAGWPKPVREAMDKLGPALQSPLAALEAAGATYDARAVRAALAATGASLASLCSLPDGGADLFFDRPLEVARTRVRIFQNMADLIRSFRAEPVDQLELFSLHEQLAVALQATTDLQRLHTERRRREEGLPPPPWARCQPVFACHMPEDPMLVEVSAEDAERIPPRLARTAQRALLWAVASSGIFCLLNLAPGCASLSQWVGQGVAERCGFCVVLNAGPLL